VILKNTKTANLCLIAYLLGDFALLIGEAASQVWNNSDVMELRLLLGMIAPLLLLLCPS
jgi:hypothetical protein